jgi:phage terminase large subunit-like protein
VSAEVFTGSIEEVRALKRKRLALLEEKARRVRGNKLATYCPYRKQREFHHNSNRERLLMAGNQLGKTWSAAYETAMHMTGRYPFWWQGKRFDKAIQAWGAGVTSEVVRDSMQLLLCGKFEELGTGTIPRDCFVGRTTKRGIPKALDTIRVRHVSGGVSELTFKSYDSGREKFQAATLDWVWLDEEPPDIEIYLESLTRTNATGGCVAMTFTPLQGMTATVKRFLIDKSPGTAVITMTIYDAEHYTPEEREAIIASYPAHTRKARAMGIPTLGSGIIFPIDPETIKVKAFPIPDHWPRIAGIDFGWDHPSAAVELCHDREADVVYVTKAHRQREQTPLLFSATLKPWGDWLPWAWPHDGLQHDKGSGEALRDQYAGHGLHMLEDKATHPPDSGKEEGSGGNSVEAGLLRMLDRMQTGRFKVFDHLNDWFEEAALYHRDEGKIVKLDDDLMSATRYAEMMLRFAVTRPAPMKAFAYKSRMLT